MAASGSQTPEIASISTLAYTLAVQHGNVGNILSGGGNPDFPADDAVEAVGKMTEALEFVERARGHLYSFHQLIGHADLLLGEGGGRRQRRKRHECSGQQDLQQHGNTLLVIRLRKEEVGLEARTKGNLEAIRKVAFLIVERESVRQVQQSKERCKPLERNARLAQALGITGTPGFVGPSGIIRGAADASRLSVIANPRD